jgi:CheY-like chemotaxis protein
LQLLAWKLDVFTVLLTGRDYSSLKLHSKSRNFSITVRLSTRHILLVSLQLHLEAFLIGSKQSTLVIISNNASFIYLIQRYADRIGFSVTVVLPTVLAETISRSVPIAAIFSSTENLEASQALVTELTNRDVPIMVCSSEIDQIRTRELGADYCLLHPLTYDEFQAALASITASNRV